MSPTRTGAVDASPVRSSTRSISISSAPSPYLNVTSRHSIHRGTSNTSSCSTFTHSRAPMPSGNTNISGSENGSVVYPPRSRSHTTGGLRHSSIVVHTENVGAKGTPSIVRSLPSVATKVELVNDRPAEALLRAAEAVRGAGDRGRRGRPGTGHRVAARLGHLSGGPPLPRAGGGRAPRRLTGRTAAAQRHYRSALSGGRAKCPLSQAGDGLSAVAQWAR